MGIDKELLEVISSIKDLNRLELFFKEILTPSETEDLSLRWKLLKDLNAGVPQRKIARKYGISLCKITRGSKILKNKDSVSLEVLNRK